MSPTVLQTAAVPVFPVSRWNWPGLLIVGPASVIVASIITAFFVVNHPDGLVASDYYKQGKAINAQLSQLSRAQQLGTDSMKLSASGSTVTLRFPEARDVTAIEVTLAHPVDPDRDIRAVLAASTTGTYELALKAPLTERRRVVVTDAPARSWRVESLLIPAKN